MASNFAFLPMGLSQSMTVGGGNPATISLVLQAVGAAGTQTVAAGNYVPKAVRISNDGTASAFINFGLSAGTISVSTTNGMKIRNASDAVVSTGGLAFVAGVCAGTFTTTLSITPGEGLA